MKIFKNLFAAIFVLAAFNLSYSQTDTIKCKATNFEITNGGTLFTFDIYLLRQTPGNFIMGNSSFYFRFNSGVLSGATLTNKNPRYNANSSYGNMFAVSSSPAGFVGVQVLYNAGQPGEIITNVPGSTGYGERLCTINLNILMAVAAGLVWDLDNSGIVNPGFAAAFGNYDGSYNGILPVELSSFVSVIQRNSVTLKWETTSEMNNSGFEIERKSSEDNAEWSKIAFVNGNGTTSETKSYSYSDNSLNTGTYNYRLKQIDFNGNFEYFELQNEVEIGAPIQFELSQNYPNPFNPSTKINFSLPFDAKVKLEIFDISGKLVSTLLNNEFKSANYYTIEFNGSNLSSGTYFYTIQSGNNFETRKMILLK